MFYLRCSKKNLLSETLFVIFVFIIIGFVFFFTNGNLKMFRLIDLLSILGVIAAMELLRSFEYKDFKIIDDKFIVEYSFFKLTLIEVPLKTIETLRFDVTYIPRSSPIVKVIYKDEGKKRTKIRFRKFFKNEEFKNMIELLRLKGNHVIWTEETEIM